MTVSKNPPGEHLSSSQTGMDGQTGEKQNG